MVAWKLLEGDQEWRHILLKNVNRRCRKAGWWCARVTDVPASICLIIIFRFFFIFFSARIIIIIILFFLLQNLTLNFRSWRLPGLTTHNSYYSFSAAALFRFLRLTIAFMCNWRSHCSLCSGRISRVRGHGRRKSVCPWQILCQLHVRLSRPI